MTRFGYTLMTEQSEPLLEKLRAAAP